jgi:ABC-type uncharacterized transport system permease subunit
MPPAMMATVVQGDAAMAEGTASPTVGVLVHLVLSALFGAIFALAVPRLRTNGTVAVPGTAYGLLLYVVNFLVLTPLLFTTFRAANQPFEVFAHLVFGTLLRPWTNACQAGSTWWGCVRCSPVAPSWWRCSRSPSTPMSTCRARSVSPSRNWTPAPPPLG